MVPRQSVPAPAQARDRHPLHARRVVRRARRAAPPVREIVEVHGREIAEALEVIAIPVEPEPLDRSHPQAGFFEQLAAGGGFQGFFHFHESARNRPHAGERLVFAADQQHPRLLLPSDD